MTRLPELKNHLVDVAQRLEEQEARAARSRSRRRGVPLLAALAGLAISGAAVASVAVGLLDRGAPVPEAPPSKRQISAPAPDQPRPAIAVTAPDPDGGPRWGLLASPSAQPGGACLQAARVQGGQLGVVGQDGVFDDDGKFHPLAPASLQAGSCGSKQMLLSAGPPRPASGYTGPPGPPLGGCREPVDLDGPTVSPETRRKLRNVPVCSSASARVVRYGFAGAGIVEVRLKGPLGQRSTKTANDGRFLLVARPADLGTESPRQLLVHRDGSVTDAFPDAVSTRPRRQGKKRTTP